MGKVSFTDKAPLLRLAVSAAALTFGFVSPVQAVQFNFVNQITIPGEMLDAAPGAPDGSTPNQNRLGGFGSDLFYDDTNNVWYGLVDRGPGGGLISFETRVEKFTMDVHAATGAISNFQLLDTIKFSNGSGAYNGLNPGLQNGDKSVLGNSFDPEGLVVNKSNGHMYVADEYGPSVIEFDETGSFVRQFTTPANLIPTQPDGADAGTAPDLNYVDGRPTITNGRQDNRGFEGLTVSEDGSKMYAILQDALVNEGSGNQGRRSPNLRIVEFDTATGLATKQVVYQLESIADINARTPGVGDNDFTENQQGRSIGVSAILAMGDDKFLVLERDNRGVGVDPAANALPVASKRVYQIDISGATDVSGISLAGSNSLPGGVIPVTKSLYIDIQAALLAANLPVLEKYEGLMFGPTLPNGRRTLMIANDNDVSVTQSGSGEQFDVCRNTSTGVYTYDNTFGGGCPVGSELLRSSILSFAEVPEPVTSALLLSGLGGMAWLRRRRG
ncbi:MAG: esterase-like activity of phytase family protein [Alphaproteobacteria bacterium]